MLRHTKDRKPRNKGLSKVEKMTRKIFKGTSLLGAIVLVVFTILPAQAAQLLDFDQVVDGGSLSYNGTGGALIGTAIRFDLVRGIETPSEAGTELDCIGCLLNFATGTNLAEGTVYQWGGGGTYILTGALMNGSTEIASGTLVSGTWSAPVIGLISPGPSPGIIISGFGIDTKHVGLTNFYDVSPLSYVFASSEIAASVTLSGNGSFDGNVSEADLVNTPFDTSQQITGQPEPSTLLLLSIGLIGMTGLPATPEKAEGAWGTEGDIGFRWDRQVPLSRYVC